MNTSYLEDRIADYHNTMQPGKVVAEVDPERFLPYAELKYES